MSEQRLRGSARQKRNRQILAESDVCHICGKHGATTVDHVLALNAGGTEERSNLAPAHSLCNRLKSDKPYAPVIRRSSSLA